MNNMKHSHTLNQQDPIIMHNINRPTDPTNIVGLSKYMHETEESKALVKKVRILCWIMTSPKSHGTKAKTVKETWGRRCNTLVFISSEVGK